MRQDMGNVSEFCMCSGEKNSKGNVMAKQKEVKANFKGGYKADTAEVEFNYVKVKPLVKEDTKNERILPYN